MAKSNGTRKVAREILNLKIQMESLKAEYDVKEAFLLKNLALGEEVETEIGKVGHSQTTRMTVDGIHLSKIIPFTDFVKCVSPQIGKVKELLSLSDLAKVSDTKVFERLNVLLNKEVVG